MKRQLTYILLTILSILFIGCGSGGGDTSNNAPMAENQHTNTNKDTAVDIILTGSDNDSDINALRYTIVTQPKHGTLICTDNNCIYTPRTDYAGQDYFTFKIRDEKSDSNIAKVTITIKENSKPEFTSGNTYTIQENKQYITTIKATDNTEITYSISSGTDKEKLTIDSHGGELIFNNKPDFENPQDLDADNQYEVTIKATDIFGNYEILDAIVTVTDKDENIPLSYKVEKLKNGANVFNIGATQKDLYILLTNKDKVQNSDPTISHNAKNILPSHKKVSTQRSYDNKPDIHHAPAYITEFNRNSHKLLKKDSTGKRSKTLALASKRQKDTAGDTATFYPGENTDDPIQATVRKVVSDISTKHGTKTLNVWVQDSSFGTGCAKTTCVTQEMVDNLADTFLKAGDNNDIYDWVTNIYGEEWGSDAARDNSNYITTNNEITILLEDIDNDDDEGSTIGYFYSKDNIKKSIHSGSNERIMFYIDSAMFANEGEYWKKEVYSTLSHEFVHMIEYYQKSIKQNADHDVWIAEMLAETTEDLIATKIEHTGPRGIVYTDGTAGPTNNTKGRYPMFNKNSSASLTAWNNSIAEYSKVNAFGTFLTRNYGGAKVLHDIMHNTKEHEDAVEYAVNKAAGVSNKTFDDLLREWGISIMLSDIESPENQPTYNTGDFTPNSYGDTVYMLGSINFFNYNPKPYIPTSTGTVQAQGNYYYKIGENLTGDITIDLSLDNNTEATLIVK